MTARPKRETSLGKLLQKDGPLPPRRSERWSGTHSTMRLKAASEEASLASCHECGRSGGRHGGMCSLG